MSPTAPVEPSDVSFVFQKEPIQKKGDDADGSLLEYYRNYLLKIANQQMDRDVSVKVPASDIVQNTLTLAHKNYEQFEGTTRKGFLCWLKTILENELATAKRRFVQTRKRDIGKEVSLPGNAACGKEILYPLDDSFTPSQPLIQQESLQIYRKAMATIPAQYQQVIKLRSLESRPFAEVAQAIGKSVGATQKLWARAIQELKQELLKSDPRYHERF